MIFAKLRFQVRKISKNIFRVKIINQIYKVKLTSKICHNLKIILFKIFQCIYNNQIIAFHKIHWISYFHYKFVLNWKFKLFNHMLKQIANKILNKMIKRQYKIRMKIN